MCHEMKKVENHWTTTTKNNNNLLHKVSSKDQRKTELESLCWGRNDIHSYTPKWWLQLWQLCDPGLSHVLSLYKYKESAKLGDNIVPQFARAAIMNYHTLGDLIEIYSLAVLQAGNPDEGLSSLCSLWGWHPSMPVPSFCWGQWIPSTSCLTATSLQSSLPLSPHGSLYIIFPLFVHLHVQVALLRIMPVILD